MLPHETRRSTTRHYTRRIDPSDGTPLIALHERTRELRPIRDLFMEKVEQVESGCWLWRGYIDKRNGYGKFRWPGETSKPAHRAAWRIFRGEIPAGLQVDHLCWVRACVNPDHLEPVTPQENVLRSSALGHCPAGHEWTEENTGQGDGFLYCRACKEAS